MGDRLKRGLRFARAAVGWVSFGVSAAALSVIVFPLLDRLVPRRDPELRTQRILARGYYLWERVMVALRVIHVTWTGSENLVSGEPRIFLANHPTLLDAPLILARLDHGDVVVAADKAQHWVIRGTVRAAGYVATGTGPGVVEACVARLRAGRSLLLFPEGTRSPKGALNPFQRGAAHIALRSGCDVVPISVDVAPLVLSKGQKWYDVPERARFAFRVFDPIAPKKFADDERSAGQNARHLTAEFRRVLAGDLRTSDDSGP